MKDFKAVVKLFWNVQVLNIFLFFFLFLSDPICCTWLWIILLPEYFGSLLQTRYINGLLDCTEWNYSMLDDTHTKKLINKQGIMHKEWNKQRMKSHLQISHHGNPKSKYFRQYKEFRIRKWWIAVSIWTTAHLPLPKPNVNPNLLSADCCGVRGGVGA